VWLQRTITFEPRPRGIHLVTHEVLEALPELDEFGVGMLQLLIQHTSASLTLNENASPEVRADLETWLDRAVPEGARNWTHTLEGDDDMPAHVKAALMGPSLTLPLREGRPALGTWQGIYLCEHRDRGGPRSVVATAWGEDSISIDRGGAAGSVLRAAAEGAVGSAGAAAPAGVLTAGTSAPRWRGRVLSFGRTGLLP
jgi:secondary thiamine-phosphate synthase enzyme